MRPNSNGIKKTVDAYVINIDGVEYIKETDTVKKLVFSKYEDIGCVIEEKKMLDKKIKFFKIVSAKSSKVFAKYVILE